MILGVQSRVIPRTFYARDPAHVAPELLGKILVRNLDQEVLAGVIVEVEAYLPFGDAASHGFKRTKTRDSLYLQGGHAYVYAMRHHFLLNAVTGSKSEPGSVLIRAIYPIAGKETMMRLRKTEQESNLANGPAKVCQALGVTTLQDGTDLATESSPLYICEQSHFVKHFSIVSAPRIGISKAKEKQLRFFIPADQRFEL